MNKNIPNSQELELMNEILSVASDTTRLKIMFSLLDDSLCVCENHCHCNEHLENEKTIEKCVNEIVLDVNASQSLVSHQLKVLKDAGLVGSRKESTKVYYFLKDEHVRKLIEVVLEHAREKLWSREYMK